MKRETVRLWDSDVYSYPSAWGFQPRLDAYVHDDGICRPAVIVVPGGGYRRCAPREGEAVALRFFCMGYHAFVCTYTTNPLGLHPLQLQPARDVAQAVHTVRKHAHRWKVAPERVALCGFSAGGHAAATVGVHWQLFQNEIPACKPDALLLCYPVISVCSDISHGPSDRALLGDQPREDLRKMLQLENQVSSACPPVFLWHTSADRTVDPENSRRFASACRKAGVPCSFRLFSSGDHGLSLADGSIRICDGTMYTLEQTACVLAAHHRGDLKLAPEEESRFLGYPEVRMLHSHGSSAGAVPTNEEVKTWTADAQRWLDRLWGSPDK